MCECNSHQSFATKALLNSYRHSIQFISLNLRWNGNTAIDHLFTVIQTENGFYYFMTNAPHAIFSHRNENHIEYCVFNFMDFMNVE